MKNIYLPMTQETPLVADLSNKICELVGSIHSDVLFPALAAVFVAGLKQLPQADLEQALKAFEANVRTIASWNPTPNDELYK